ncbi:hypothetical protein P7D58_00590 [Enterococcus avium]|uniref:hypothetical protein n=1 Tax=Enterococcus avium TaxID=33945 RepID=UPI002892581F|nr:hypothetical protein [Enterococcus avium]MDT2392127.1 hypothetical protein [Enterococcus avium]MDT2416729.1 hypothetical protein [Enterococcus avium]MDT2429497.1 hypothetical protein [Enterococcus avium]MDT2438483.1 hypothetical protein [Enterococcus avium]MDT2451335.1 hypothetical protein [Enterococcus avium]
MLKLVWVPKEYKNFSFREMAEDANRIIEECKEAEKRNALLYADIMILQNKIANLTEEEARHNLEVLIPWLESQFPSLKNEF